MRVSAEEMLEQGLDVKRWLSGLQLQVKSGGSPEFQLKGPCEFQTRYRLGKGATTRPRYYMGDEKFRLADIFFTRDSMTKEIVVSVTFVPVDAKLIAEISSASMELDKALSLFDGIEDWFLEAKTAASTRARKIVPTHPVIKKEEERPEWGAW